jgi:hypothetical protein
LVSRASQTSTWFDFETKTYNISTFMKSVAFLLFFAIATTAFNIFAAPPDAPPDVSKYLNYPNTTLVAASKTEGSRIVVPIAANFDRPKKKNSAPRFYSNSSNDVTDDVSVDYEMFKKTDYGDLYLLVIHRKGQKDVPYPVLFSGSAQTIVDASDIKVELLPNPPPPDTKLKPK